jgi:hypothetical protein
MKTLMRVLVPLPCAAALALCSGCASFSFDQNVARSQRVSQPPPGKALVNFHRPSGWAGSFLAPVFNGNRDFIGLLRGASEFQWICPPGEQVFIGWSEEPVAMKLTKGQSGSVAVLQAEVQADKIYDIMVDLTPGWGAPAVAFSPLVSGSERRNRLAEFEGREKTVTSGVQQTVPVAEYRRMRQSRADGILQDFLHGSKKDRLRYLKKEDFR